MFRFRTVAFAAVVAAGVTAGTVTAASAGTPSPSPSPVSVPVHHRVAATPWQFDLEQSDIGAVHVNDVEATGPILAHAWTDTQLSPNVDKFSLGANSVTLRHDSLLGARISENLRTCTVTLDQPNGRFRIIAGTGTGAHFVSLNGRFDLQAMFSFPLITRHHRTVCPLVFVNRFVLLRELALNGPVNLPAPTFDNVSVQGRADLLRVIPHVFAPTASPTETASA